MFISNQKHLRPAQQMITMKRTISILLALALLLLCCCHAEENAQADLQARFGGQATLEYGGKSYAVKKRNTTLMIGACEDGHLLLCYLLAVDDDQNRIVPIRLDVGAVDDANGMTLARIYRLDEPAGDASIPQADADAQRLLSAVNALFPEPLIDSYLLLNAEGLDLLDGGAENNPELSQAENIKERIKAIGKTAVNASSSQQMDMVDKMSPYLITDVKTGALVKIADKAKRYEIVPTQWFYGEHAPASAPQQSDDGGLPVPVDALLVPRFHTDEEKLMELLVEYFYDETTW